MRRWAAARPLAVREAPSRQTSVWRTPPDLPCGARPARPLADRAASFARRVASKPGQALQASRHSPVGPPPFGTADTSPAGLAPPPIGQSHPMSGTKLSQHTTKRRYQAISRLQGELCTAQSTNKPSRENFVPHTGPLAGQNSPHTKPGGSNRYKTLPAGSPDGPTRDKTLPTHHKTAIPSHFSLAGRTLYRSIHQQAEQGELCTAHRTTCGTKLSPLNSSAEATGQNSPRSS